MFYTKFCVEIPTFAGGENVLVCELREILEELDDELEIVSECKQGTTDVVEVCLFKDVKGNTKVIIQ